MRRIDEDLIKRQEPKTVLRINDDICIDKCRDDRYHVMVWCAGAYVWISYNLFDTLNEAVAWASIEENVR